jgi:DNA-binding NtrC family response regulator
MRLLIVDDDPATLLGLRDALQTRLPNSSIATADSGENALATLYVSNFDVVLSDVRMPGMDGMALLREIKARHPQCIVFLMTGHGVDLRMEALRLGASSFLEKPLDLPRLTGLLSRAVEQAKLLNAWHERSHRSNADT